MKRQPSAILSIDLAGVCILGGLTAAAFFGGVSPAMQAVTSAEKERAALKAGSEEAAGLERTLTEAQRQLQSLASPEQQVAGAAGSALDRISRISELAAASSVSITDLTPKPEVTGTRFNRVPISVAGLGTSVAFQALLQRLHQQYPDTQVVSLTITGSPENREAPAAFTAELVWYTIAGGSDKHDAAGGAARAAAASAGQPRNP